MSYPSSPRLLTVLNLRLKGFVAADVVADAAGVDLDQVESTLAELEAAGHARYREGRISGWMLTPEGRAEGERELAAELDAAGARDVVSKSYQGFLAMNQDMLGACTAWQMREEDGEQKVNDHSDADYDAAVIASLAAIDDRVQPICADLAGALERFDGYGARFTASLEKLRGGDIDWFTKPVIDSYHTVWFELHENLLASLGIDRATEGH